MAVSQIISSALKNGIVLYLKDGGLAYKATEGTLTEALKQEIIANKQDIISYLVEMENEKEGIVQSAVNIPIVADRDKAPLSYAQQRLWFIAQLDNASSQYNMPAQQVLREAVDLLAFEQAYQALVARHEVLRTCYIEEDGVPSQVVQQDIVPRVRFTDLSGLEETARAEALSSLCDEEASTPFDLACDVMLRVHLVKLEDCHYRVLFTMHHIASDGWSMAILESEFGTLYRDALQGKPSSLAPLPIQYADYASWQREWLAGERLAREVGYWKEQLSGVPQVHNLPLDKPRGASQSFDGRGYGMMLDAGLTRQVRAYCQRHDVTLFMFMQTAFAVLLGRYSGEQDIVMGSPISGRVHQDIEGLIGFFVNTLVLRSDVGDERSFAEQLSRNKDMILDAYEHQHVPFEMLVDELQPGRSLSYSPLFQVLFSLEHNGVEFEESHWAQAVKFDLELTVNEGESCLGLSWGYDRSLFEADTIARMSANFAVLLSGIVSDMTDSVRHLPLLSEPEQARLLDEWNATSVPYRTDLSIHALFEEQVRANPTQPAVVYEGQQLSYEALNDYANQLAGYLQSEGVGPGDFVGVYLPRSLEMVVALLSVLKAGAAYVPMDPAYSAQRLVHIVTEAKPKQIITLNSMMADLQLEQQAFVCLDNEQLQSSLRAHTADLKPVDSTASAYVLYTSGSTGRPKGIEISHCSAVAMLAWARRTYTDKELSRVLCCTSINFDLSVFELFVPLCFGFRCILVDNGLSLLDSGQSDEVSSVTLINTVPSVMALLLEQGAVPPSVTVVNLAGEPLPSSTVNRLLKETAVMRVFNLYGPSEDTTYSTFAEFNAPVSEKPWIGGFLDNGEGYVLDAYGELLPQGCTGELYLGGAGLAKGYLNQPALTDERFVPNPFGEGRLYRTGDLVRWRPDGALEYIGRNDSQVKLRGFRIELGEIEHALQGCEGVDTAVVQVHRTETTEQLVAYIESQDEAIQSVCEAALSSRLPAYMVPSVYIVLEQMPLLPNGKVDRHSLPAPTDADLQTEAYVAPETETEHQLCEIWQSLLGVERVGVKDNFFSLGGHSLLATQLMSRVRQQFCVEVGLKSFFAKPTVSGLAVQVMAGQEVRLPAIVPLTERDSMPLSYAQQRLWFIAQLDNASSQYNMPAQQVLREAVDLLAFEQAYQALVTRHEVLRTCYIEEDGVPSQVVQQDIVPRVRFTDLSGLEETARAEALSSLCDEEASTPFDLACDVMLRVHLVKLEDCHYRVLFTMHHIASDGWSMAILESEFGTLYRDALQGKPSSLAPLPIQYADYASWQREWLAGERLAREVGYWKEQLSGVPQVHNLPLDKPRGASQSFDGRGYGMMLDAGLTRQVRAYCQRHDVTLFMFMQTAFAVLLGRYSGEQDIVMGSPISGRVHQDIEGLIGFFVNTLVLRSDVGDERSFAEQLSRNKDMILDAYEHQHVPFEMLVDELQPGRSLSYSPLFQVLFSLEHNGVAFEESHWAQAVKFDLELTVNEGESCLGLSWGYDRSLFEADTIARMSANFAVLLSGIVSDMTDSVRHLPLLSEPEQARLLDEWNATSVPYRTDLSIHALFEEQVRANPTQPAVVYEGQQLSYEALNDYANQLAGYLQSEGVGPGDFVGVYLPRSLEMVVALLSVLKAGAAYVPMDPDYPESRLQHMIDNSGMGMVITTQEADEQSGLHLPAVVCLDDPQVRMDIGKCAKDNPALVVDGEASAYVIYTSGSTGVPKGVLLRHSGLVNMVHLRSYLGLQAGSRVLQFSALSFDASVFEWSLALTSGATLYICDSETRLSGTELSEYLLKNQITNVTLPPAMLRFLNFREDYALKGMQLAGEACDTEEAWKWASQYQVYNAYGPSEYTICSHIGPITAQCPITLGKGITNTQSYVLDAYGELLPQGCTGELYLGGAGLAKGYLNQPALTEERFVPNPFGEGRLYRTGDLVRWRPDGALEYIGRNDSQVKLRGFRIELGEIEHALQGCEGVDTAVVQVHRTETTEQLVAYIESQDEAIQSVCEAALSSRLPAYMVPSVYIVLEQMPLLPNGKVDRHSLPAPTDADLQTEVYVAPETETEHQLCEIWQSLLGVERVGVKDNFFSLGGHSLLATQLMSRVRQQFCVEVGLKSFFAKPTVSGLAVQVMAGQEVRLPAIVPLTERDSMPLSYAQQRLWFIAQLDNASSQYNMPAQQVLREAVDLLAFEQAYQALVARHEVLRTCYIEEDGVPSQVVQQDIVPRVRFTDLSGLEETARAEALSSLCDEEASTPFDLACDVMLRVHLVKLEDCHYRVLFTMHHIASDGWSMAILESEFGTLYRDALQGKPSSLAPLPIQYADYASWQREWLAGERLAREVGYWKEQLSGVPQVHNLPLDKPRGASQSFDGRGYGMMLDAGLTRQVRAYCQRHDVTLFMFMQTAFAVLLGRYSGEQDIVMGSPISGRVHQDIEGLIGFFVNTLVLRSDVGDERSFAEQLSRNKDMILDAYEHQHVPFEMLVDELQPGRSLSYSPLFQVLFSLEHNGVEFEESHWAQAVKFDLELTVNEGESCLGLSWGYDRSLFEADTIARMSANFAVLLSGIVSDMTDSVRHLPLLSEPEQARLLDEWNATSVPYRTDLSIHALFEEQVRANPTQPAVVYEGQQLSYEALNDYANQLAGYLQSEGVGPGDFVGVYLPRSLEMVVALLSVLKAGAAYVPMDPAYSAQRLVHIVTEAKPKQIITLNSMMADLQLEQQAFVCLDNEQLQSSLRAHTADLKPVDSTASAYVLYTSGSTGRPKGIEISHCSAVAMLAWARRTYTDKELSRVLCCTSINFDLSVFELFVPLCFGFRCILVDNGLSLLDSGQSDEVSSVTLINTVPSVMALLLEQGAVPPSVTVVNLAGEPLPSSTVNRLLKETAVMRVFNLYGPSEDTTYSTFAEFNAPVSEKPWIGGFLDNGEGYVLDAYGELLPQGCTGELYLGGAGLAKGYLNQPALTDERFVPNPFGEGRLYRTGDLVRWRPDGALEYIGRNDSQVKLRGFRIELGEIEHALQGCEGVDTAVVQVHRTETTEQLVAYIESQDEAIQSVCEAALSSRLPAYMVPSVYIVLEQMPLLPNGKVDRHSLPAPTDADLQTEVYVAPETETEHQLCEIWQSLLGVERVGVKDNFFSLGGHSLLATQLMSRVRQQFCVEVGLKSFFAKPTVSGLAVQVMAGQEVRLPAIVPLTERDSMPLSYAQQRLWFIAQLDNASSQYNMPAQQVLREAVDLLAFEQAYQALVARHEVLRTCYIEEDGVPSQVVQQDIVPRVRFTDLSGLEETARAEALSSLCDEEASTPFDLACDVMLRVHLVKLEDCHYRVLFTMHHIASDGWSMAILESEFGTLYRDALQGKPSSLAPLPIQYADYASWQREWLAGERLAREVGYWKEQLSGVPQVHNLPLDKPRGASQSFDGRGYGMMLDAGLTRQVRAYCQRHDVTLFMFMQTAFAVLLGRYSGEQDIVMGSPISGRVHQDIEGLIGFFVNTLVLRSDVGDERSFAEQLSRNKDMILDAYEHQHVPFEMLVDELQPGRSLSYSPLFQVLFSLEHNGVEFEESHWAQAVKFDLELTVNEGESCLGLSWGYDRSLFEADTIARMSANFAVLLSGIVSDMTDSVRHLPLLSEPEQARLLDEWNATSVPYRTDLSIHALFEEQVRANPTQPAVVYEGQQLSYEALNDYANQLAGYLQSEGVGPGDFVGINLRRSVNAIVSIFAVLKCGAVFVPLDPDYPDERLLFMVRDANVKVILNEAENRLFDNQKQIDLSCLEVQKQIRTYRKKNSDSRYATDMGVYVIYTSGSSGLPKGVEVTERGLVNFTLSSIERHKISAKDKTLQCCSLGFDISVEEIFPTLCGGGTLVIAQEDWLRIGSAFWSQCKADGITRLSLPTAFWNALAEDTYKIPAAIRQIIVGGERINTVSVFKWLDRVGLSAELINSYGPTETTVAVTEYKVVEKEENTPIGQPIQNTYCYVLDAYGELLPQGCTGELYLGGAGLAKGYLNQPALTDERFVPNPFGEGRLYRTGDLVRWRPDGALEYIGRNDSQVKLRGFRIELGEIEHALQGCEGVDTAVVQVHRTETTEQLVAYIESQDEAIQSVCEAALSSRLPAYMVPSVYIVLEQMPLLPNGKVDRHSLPAPTDADLQTEAYVAPETETEHQLCEIWQSLLGVERVGVKDNFFSLGGHSLLATQLMSRVRQQFCVEVGLKSFFAKPTVSGLAVQVMAGQEVRLPAIVPLTERDSMPLSYAQQRLWFIAQLDNASSQYNMPAQQVLREAVDLLAFEQAYQALVARHEVLRTCYIEEDGVPSQVVQQDIVPRVRFTDLSGLEETARAEALSSLCDEEASTPFDLACDVMLRVHLVKLEDCHYRVLFTMHHIASDGWSMAILESEFGTLYRDALQGKPSSLAPLPIQYADYASWQREWLAGERLAREVGYWKEQLAGVPQVHNLPLDKPRGASQSFDGRGYGMMLDAGLTRQVRAYCQRHDVTLFMFMQTAFAVLLGRYSGEQDIVMGSPISGRVHQDIEGLIGFFVNTLVLRSDVGDERSFAEQLSRNKDMILDAYEHQHVPFEMLVDELQPGRSLSYSPLFQVLFSLEHNGVAFEESHWAQAVKFDLELTVNEGESCLGLSWGYDRSLFEADTIARMSANFAVLLSGIVSDKTESVRHLPLLSEPEQARLLDEWNATSVPYRTDLSIHALFEEQVRANPTQPAVVYEGQQLSYEALNDYANQLAGYLQSEGVGPGDFVGVYLPRSLEMVVALLSVLKAGAAYVPMDPDYPESRLQHMIDNSGMGMVITTQEADEQSGLHLPAVVCLDDPQVRMDIGKCAKDNPALVVDGEASAYVIYTSGSTGVPKGVLLRHSGLVNMVHLRSYLGLQAGSRVLQFSALSFDASVFEWSLALTSGATLYICDSETRLSGTELSEYLLKNQITNVTLPPAMLRFLNFREDYALKGMQLAGEACDTEEAWKWASQYQVYNAYGPSEYTICSHIGPITAQCPITLGKGITNTQSYVLDAYGELLPQGCTGELYLGGAGLAKGYLNQPALTEERFVPNPFGEGRLYRTGDLVRWRPDGALEYIGRNDSQVKLRGFRIELGEIEHALQGCEGVDTAVVQVHRTETTEQLVAYIESQDEAIQSVCEAALSSRLPAYMVPSVYIVLEQMPLLPNGKVDRHSLPAPTDADLQTEVYVAPETETEHQLCEIWQSLLGVERVGVKDNFFSLGGHSLLIMPMLNRVKRTIKKNVTVSAFYQNPTINGIMAYVPVSSCKEGLIELRSGDVQYSPLYICHTVMSDFSGYNDLLHHLKYPGPIKGLLMPDKYRKEKSFVSVDRFAGDYADLILNDIGSDDINLMGWSFGGAAILEIAAALDRKGFKPSFVGLIDTVLPEEQWFTQSQINEQLQNHNLLLENEILDEILENELKSADFNTEMLLEIKTDVLINIGVFQQINRNNYGMEIHFYAAAKTEKYYSDSIDSLLEDSAGYHCTHQVFECSHHSILRHPNVINLCEFIDRDILEN